MISSSISSPACRFDLRMLYGSALGAWANVCGRVQPMALSNSATEPKSNPSEKFAVRLRASLFGAHRRSCCASLIPDPSEKPVVHNGGHVGSGATSDEIEEHLKWVAEWIDSSKSPATSSPLR